ncbi:MAG: YfhO family protein [Chloroflexota bacterium]
MTQRVLSWVLFAVAIGFIMSPWLSTPSPLTVNSENVPEISYIWSIRSLIEAGHPFSGWNPKALGGEAVITHFLYPLYWSIALLSSLSNIAPETLYKGMVFAHLWLGSVFMYEFLQQLTRRPVAGLVAGLIFSLTPGHMNSIEGFFIKVSWLAVPLIFWLYEREFGQRLSPTIKGGIRLGFAVALMGLASIQIPLIMLFILPPYILLREWQQMANQTDGWAQRGNSWLATTLVTVGSIAYFYIPVVAEFNHLSFSRFTDVVNGGTVDASFLRYMLTARWYPSFSPYNFHEVTWYLGGAALILAFSGLFSATKNRLFFVATAILSLLLLVGNSLGPIPNVIWQLVDNAPLVSGVLRHSFRWVLPLSFSLAVLAGFGVAYLTTKWPRLSTDQWSYGLIVILAVILTFDYSPLFGSFRAPASYLQPAEIEALAWLDQQANEQPGYRHFTPFPKGTPRTYDLVFAHHLSRGSAVWDDQYVSHYVSKRAYTFFAGLNVQYPVLEGQSLDPLFLQMLNLGSVRYLFLTLESSNHTDLYQTASALGAETVFEKDQVRIVYNADAKSPIQLYDRIALYQDSLENETQILGWLPKLAPENIVLVEDTVEAKATNIEAIADYVLRDSQMHSTASAKNNTEKSSQTKAASPSLKNYNVVADLTWERASPSRMSVHTTVTQDTVVVFTEAWHPGWRVFVNDIEQPLLRTNFAFQGVLIPAGEHTITFQYLSPFYFWIGLLISILTIGASLGYLWRGR